MSGKHTLQVLLCENCQWSLVRCRMAEEQWITDAPLHGRHGMVLALGMTIARGIRPTVTLWDGGDGH